MRNLGAVANARALAGYVAARLRRAWRSAPERTFEQWVTARFGRPLYEAFFGPYTQKLWGLHPSAISADWAAERISLLNLGDAALRMAGLRHAPIRTYARRYRYPRLGMGQLYEVIATDIRRLGGTVNTGARAVALETRRTRAEAVIVETGRGHERIPVGQLLATIPLPELVRLLRPARSTELARAADSLRFRALCFVNLLLGRRDFSDNTWMYVASPRFRTSRIQEPKRRSEAMAPEGRTSLMLEVPCDVGDRTWSASTGELRELVAQELDGLGFRVDDVVDAFCVRVEHGYPVYRLGYEADRQALLGVVAGFENVQTAGRQGLFRYVFMDAAMQMGIAAAEQMVRGEQGTRRLDAIGRSNRVIEAQAVTA